MTTAAAKRQAAKGKLEVHEHCIVSGPRSNRSGKGWPAGMGGSFAHSHEGGNVPHEHPDTGPGSYTIDKDEWLRATGLRGGGRKAFTVKPSGEQFPFVAREPMTFEIHIVGDGGRAASGGGEGPGIALPMRIAMACKLTPVVVSESGPVPKKGRPQRGATRAQLAHRAKLFAPASPSIHDDVAALAVVR